MTNPMIYGTASEVCLRTRFRKRFGCHFFNRKLLLGQGDQVTLYTVSRNQTGCRRWIDSIFGAVARNASSSVLVFGSSLFFFFFVCPSSVAGSAVSAHLWSLAATPLICVMVLWNHVWREVRDTQDPELSSCIGAYRPGDRSCEAGLTKTAGSRSSRNKKRCRCVWGMNGTMMRWERTRDAQLLLCNFGDGGAGFQVPASE